MKLTGKLMKQDVTSFTCHKKDDNGCPIPRRWIVVGDRNLFRFYNKLNGTIELIGEAEPDSQDGWRSVINFTTDITDFLEKIETFDVFDRLIIIATPEILHELNTSFSKLVENKIIAEIHKDLSRFKDGDLKEELDKILWF